MAELFGRVARVSVGGLQWSDLRVTFRVVMTTDRHPNQLDLSLYALNQEHRGQIALKDQEVRLVAGYPDTASLLFAGQLTHAVNIKQAGGWVANLEARDGHKHWQTRVSEAFAKSTSHQTIATKIAAQMGFTLSAQQLAIIGGGAVPDATVLYGRCSTEFDELMRSLNVEWSIQHGVLQLTPLGQPTTELVQVIGPQTGLIGNVEREAAQKGKAAPLKWKQALSPESRPGRHVKLDSRTFSGFARIDKVTHIGDTHGADWQSECEGHEV